MNSPAAPYLLFLVTAFVMLVVGGLLQTLLPIQVGLIASSLLAVAAVAFVFRKLAAGDIEFPGFARPEISAADLGAIIVTAAVLGVFANVTAALLVELLPALGERRELYKKMVEELLNPDSAILAGLAIFSITVVAPVCEEYLFRGTILPAQRENEPEFRAIALNGILFGMIHFNEMAFVSLSIVGAFFAHITLRTRTLWPAIIAHAALNAVNGVLMPYLTEKLPPESIEEPTLAQLAGAFVVFALLAGVLWRVTAKRLARSRDRATRA